MILETTAPPDAVFVLRGDVGHYDEQEAIVDPYKPGPVTVAERLTNSSSKMSQGKGGAHMRNRVGMSSSE